MRPSRCTAAAAYRRLRVPQQRCRRPAPDRRLRRRRRAGRLLLVQPLHEAGNVSLRLTPGIVELQARSDATITYTASDGSTIAVISLPFGVPPKNLPMTSTCTAAHGRATTGDIAVRDGRQSRLRRVEVNFRGSTGYGKSFLDAGNRQWAGTMHQDLIDAKKSAVAQGYADPSKVAIMGGSYGGYATLAAVTFSPDALRRASTSSGRRT